MSLDKPHRVQRQRTKGWRLPPHTKCVDRSTRYGNFVALYPCVSREEATRRFRAWLMLPDQEWFRAMLRENLRGWNVACFCRVDQSCHGDVVLEVANGEES